MDEIRPYRETLIFALFRPEFHFRPPDDDLDRLLDVEVRLRVVPNFLPDPKHLGDILNDLHLYLGTNDLTEALLRVLRRQIDSGDQESRRGEYLGAIDRVAPLWAKLYAYQRNIAADEAAARQLAAAQPLSKALSRLGASAPGSGGPLGIYCFLYTEVKLPPIRLVDVLAEHNSLHNTSLAIGALRTSDLIFSPGPDILMPPQSTTTDALYGALDLSLELRYHNPNDDAISELAGRVTTLERQVNTLAKEINKRLGEIRKEISPIGPIQKTQQEATLKLNELTEAIQRHEQHVVNQERELASLWAKADEIQKLIQALH